MGSKRDYQTVTVNNFIFSFILSLPVSILLIKHFKPLKGLGKKEFSVIILVFCFSCGHRRIGSTSSMLSHFALRSVVVPKSTKFCSSTDEGIRGNKSELAGGASTIVMSTSVCPPSLVRLFSRLQSDRTAKIEIHFVAGSTVIFFSVDSLR